MYNGLNHLYERSCDNSHENTAKRLPPTMQFKAPRVQHVSSGWQMLSPWLILPRSWQIVSLHAAATLWSKQSARCLNVSWKEKRVRGLHRVWAGRMWGGNRVDLLWMQRDWCHDHWALRCLPYLKGVDVAFDAARDACEENGNDVCGAETVCVCVWTADDINQGYENYRYIF